MQVAIAQIHEQIGAAGVVNHECKQVVAGYGQQMLELLKAQVLAHSLLETLLSSWHVQLLLSLLEKWIHSSG